MKKRKCRIRQIILFCMVTLLFFLMACIKKDELFGEVNQDVLIGSNDDFANEPSESIMAEEQYHTNTDNGNAVNGRGIAESDGCLFFSLGNGIYKCKEDGSMIEKIYQFSDRLSGGGFLIDNEWIYFEDIAEGSDTVDLFRMNISDYSIEYICESPSGSSRIYNNYMYFGNEYKMDLNTLSPIQIFDKSVASGYTVNIVDDYIFFYDVYNGNEGLYKMTLDGQNVSQIYAGRADYMLVDGDWIYFQNQNEHHDLYKMRTDGGEIQPLPGEDIRHINSDEEWLYCDAYIDYVTGIYRIKKDGSEYQLLVECEGRTQQICIINDWIYYSFIKDDDEIWRRMKLDGTNNEIFMSIDDIAGNDEEINTDESVAEQEDNIMTEEEIYNALVSGDYSYFAGTYRVLGYYVDSNGGGEDILDLVLHEDGVITGGGNIEHPNRYFESKPISVTRQEDGAYKCQVTYYDNASQSYFLIYPAGTIGPNPYIYNDPFLTENVYIQYMRFDGGVSDIIFYKVED